MHLSCVVCNRIAPVTIPLPQMRCRVLAGAFCSYPYCLHDSQAPAGAGNFMLLDEDDHSPLKAIDFGLAFPYDPSALPRSDLGLEGTPW